MAVWFIYLVIHISEILWMGFGFKQNTGNCHFPSKCSNKNQPDSIQLKSGDSHFAGGLQIWVSLQESNTGWWFGMCFFVFSFLGNSHPNWQSSQLMFFRGVETRTTNQLGSPETQQAYRFFDQRFRIVDDPARNVPLPGGKCPLNQP